MFVMNISMSQMLSSIKELAGENQVLNETFDQMMVQMRILMSPFQVLYALMQMINGMTGMVTKGLFGMATAGMAVWGAFNALNAKTNEARAIWSVYTGIMAAAAAATLYSAYAQWQEAIAKKADTMATMENTAAQTNNAIAKIFSAHAGLGPIGWALGIAAVVAAVTFLASMFATGKRISAQTSYGEERRILETGFIYAHKGEIIGRVSEPEVAGGGGSREVHVHLFSG